MAVQGNTEVPAAPGNEKRLSVSVVTGSSAILKLLVGSGPALVDRVPPERYSQLAGPAGGGGRQPRLTTRELQVLRLVAKGFHNREIARKFHRSIKTVEKHRQNLHSKLSTHEVAGLTRHALMMGLMGRPRRALRRLANRARTLTKRELEVLKLVAEGSGNKWIASELHRSIKTVDHHRENIMKKLNIHDVAGLTSYAFSLGMV